MTTFFTLTAFAVAGIPLLRVLIRRPVWTEAAARPVLFVALAGGGAVLVGAASRAAARTPSLGPLLAGAAVLGAFGFWVRARPSRGRRRRLPPGSLGLVESLDALARPDFYAEAARRWGPVFKMAQFHRPVVCITDLALGLRVLDEQRERLRPPSLPFGRVSPGTHVAFLSDRGHPRHRPVLGRALEGRVVDGAREGVATVARRELERMAEASGDVGIPPGQHLDRIGLGALLRVVGGVTPDDGRLDELERWFVELGTPRAFGPRRPEGRAEPLERLTAWIREAGAEALRRGAKGRAPPSVLTEILDADPRHLADETLLENLAILVLVTRSNVRGVLGWALKELVDHPAYGADLRTLRSEPDGAARCRERASHFVHEVLRMHQSEFFYREVDRELTIGDHRVPRGWLLRVCVREAHDDPRVFPDPRTFRPERFAERHYADTEYRPFSDGTHSPFGAAAAGMIAGVLVVEAATAFEVRGVADGPVERGGNRHWSHWRPSRSFRVTVRPASAPASGDRTPPN